MVELYICPNIKVKDILKQAKTSFMMTLNINEIVKCTQHNT